MVMTVDAQLSPESLSNALVILLVEVEEAQDQHLYSIIELSGHDVLSRLLQS